MNKSYFSDNRKQNIINRANLDAEKRNYWIKKNSYFHSNDLAYLKFLVEKNKKILDLGCGTGSLLNSLEPSYGLGIDISQVSIDIAKKSFPNLDFLCGDIESNELLDQINEKFDFIVLSDTIGYLDDCQNTFNLLKKFCNDETRIIISYHSWRWEPLLKFAEKIKLRMPTVEMNFLSTEDTINFLNLADFELVKTEWRQLVPFKFFGIGPLINNYFATLPLIRKMSLRNYIVARPITNSDIKTKKSATVLIPCRNEEGNIENAVTRIPDFCDDLEIIFVEGGSQDNTSAKIKEVINKYNNLDIKFLTQDGKGKGNAVRKGFDIARGEILMILDADLTVPPEDLGKFYDLIVSGKGEFVNGTRLIYPMEHQAMRFLNFWANRAFSVIFSFLLNQRLTDTLCGTKVLSKSNYEKIMKNREYFGDFDPFGDFDLLFGASKLNLKIIEVPIRYLPRQFGETQISRFAHGWLLLKMVIFAFKKLKILK